MRYRAVLDAESRWPRWSVAREDGHEVAYSTCEASAALAAERLSAGRPVGSPREATESSLRLYTLFPSRFDLLRDRYLLIGGAEDWLNGGLWEDDVTALTEEGMAAIEARFAEEDCERAQDALTAQINDLLARSGLTFEPPPVPGRDLALYRAGLWPEAGKNRVLSDLYERQCPLGHLLRARTSSVDPEWLEDARAACRMLIEHGDDAEGGVRVLRSWGERLAAKHGGRWLP